MTFNDFKYERIAYEELEAVYGKLLKELKEATDSLEFMKIFNEINVSRSHVMTMATLCSIRHTVDTADKFYEEENDYWDVYSRQCMC